LLTSTTNFQPGTSSQPPFSFPQSTPFSNRNFFLAVIPPPLKRAENSLLSPRSKHEGFSMPTSLRWLGIRPSGFHELFFLTMFPFSWCPFLYKPPSGTCPRRHKNIFMRRQEPFPPPFAVQPRQFVPSFPTNETSFFGSAAFGVLKKEVVPPPGLLDLTFF